MAHKLACPDCGAPMVLKPSRYKPFYGCSRWRDTGCPGSVGAHPDGSPMGIPASSETKGWRITAHSWFDLLWSESGSTRAPMKRRDAYAWMQKAMNLSADDAHIARFTAEQCQQLIALVEQELAARAPK